MRKKLFKYTKFVVSMVLILGLVAPSYASLSASDGSAFVTKAEFDSALADFNSRLTTFEAGINSKIDSQVTSYLDRNGIWNGKEQIFINTKLLATLPSMAVDPNPNGPVVNITQSEILPLIDSSKSGLCVFEWSYDAQSHGEVNYALSWWGYVFKYTDAQDYKNLFDDNLVVTLRWLEMAKPGASGVAKYVNIIGSSKASPNQVADKTYMLAIPIPVIPVAQVTMFFVEKNKKYSIQFEATMNSGWFQNYSRATDGNCQFLFNQAYVY